MIRNKFNLNPKFTGFELHKKAFKTLLDEFHVAYHDDCCDENGNPILPLSYNPTEEELSYYDPVTDTNIVVELGGGGGSVTIPATAYDNNADAVAALGVGVMYKSTTLINGSPIILITI